MHIISTSVICAAYNIYIYIKQMHTGESWKETARRKTEIEIERGGREKWMKGRNFRGEGGREKWM